jgi:hypothetical protein
MISKSLLVGGLAFALVPVIGVSPAHACSCVAATEAQQFKRAGVVFKGTVTTRDMPGGDHHDGSAGVLYTFAPSRVYKGTVLTAQPVHTARDGAACGVTLSGAGPFLVFAQRPRNATAATPLEMSLCGGTRAIGADEQPAFGEGRPVDEDPGGGGPVQPPPVPADPPPTTDHGQDAPGLLPPLLGPLAGVLGPLGG